MRASSPGANDSPSSFHDFAEQVNANITGGALHDLLNPAFLSKLLIVFRPAYFNLLLDHLEQLFASNQVIQDNNILVVMGQE